MKDIVLATINAKWIHPSLALRLLKANLGGLEERCEIIEFNLRQSLAEKLAPFIAAINSGEIPRVLGISVSIWNHTVTIEFLKKVTDTNVAGMIIVLGGPEVSYLPPDAEIFRYADYVIRGEGEIAFRELCEKILSGELPQDTAGTAQPVFINAENVDVNKIQSAYHLYTDEDVAKKLIYVESGRGCPFKCEFCLSGADNHVRKFPLEPFLADLNELIRRGAKTIKFLDRSFNTVTDTTLHFFERFFYSGTVVHFEMVPSLFPPELIDALARFPPGSLRLEIGIQTLNPKVAARISRPSNPAKELETLRLLRKKTNAIIHADLIAGLPGEDLASFGRGFDQLWEALYGTASCSKAEIQLGILKLLPGAAIARHSETFGMRYNPLPPYDVLETSAMSACDIERIKNFARFWELIVNRGIFDKHISHKGIVPKVRKAQSSLWIWNKGESNSVFNNFIKLSDSLYAHFGRNWGIDKFRLIEKIKQHTT